VQLFGELLLFWKLFQLSELCSLPAKFLSSTGLSCPSSLHAGDGNTRCTLSTARQLQRKSHRQSHQQYEQWHMPDERHCQRDSSRLVSATHTRLFTILQSKYNLFWIWHLQRIRWKLHMRCQSLWCQLSRSVF
jgi:hypothetical protein